MKTAVTVLVVFSALAVLSAQPAFGGAVGAAVKEESGLVSITVRFCGCRVAQAEEGALTARLCGCRVFETELGDIFLVGMALAGVAVWGGKRG